VAWKIDYDYVSAQPDFALDKAADGMAPWGFGWGWGTGQSLFGRPAPTSATQTDNNKLVDVFPLPGFACVSERFKNVVASLEPGVHGFHPIQLRSKKGIPHDAPYFLLDVKQRFDSILVKDNNAEWSTMLGGDLVGMPFVTKPDAARFVSRPAIAGRHLWLNHWIYSGGIMVSDRLHRALTDAKIRRLQLKEPWARYFNEVDVPFDYREQVPDMIAWMDTHRPNSVREGHAHWVQEHMPHWLS